MNNTDRLTVRELELIKNLCKSRIERLKNSNLNYSPHFMKWEENQLELIINKINKNILLKENIG